MTPRYRRKSSALTSVWLNSLWLAAMPVRIARKAALVVAFAVALSLIATPDVLAQNGESKEEQGLVVYLGILPAAMVKGHDPTHAESTMHGGSSSGPHEYHVLVAIFEASTGLRVADADVVVTIEGLGHIGGTRVSLEPMRIADTTTYGNFAIFPGTDQYTIKVIVQRRGASNTVAFEFSYDHRIP